MLLRLASIPLYICLRLVVAVIAMAVEKVGCRAEMRPATGYDHQIAVNVENEANINVGNQHATNTAMLQKNTTPTSSALCLLQIFHSLMARGHDAKL